jgi:hypothetical protein
VVCFRVTRASFKDLLETNHLEEKFA